MLKLYFFILSLTAVLGVQAQETRQLANRPDAIADLRTNEGASLVGAKWSVQPVDVEKQAFKLPGKTDRDPMFLYATGASVETNILQPQVDAKAFSNGWKQLLPAQLEQRQGNGLLSFVWYKVDLTLPEDVGKLKIDGTTAVFEIVVDDYSEIWVNGKQVRSFGQSGNGLISGYNARNRVLLTSDAKAGEKYSIAILGINGPLGMIPENYIWVRNATIDFYHHLPTAEAWKDVGKIYVVDEKIKDILPFGTKVEKVADGFQFTEGPVWHPDGYLLFSDPNTNTIYRYNPADHNVTVYMSHSGYTGADISEYSQPGSNGLAIDKEGRLIVDQHGNRRVVRYEKKGPLTVLVDKIDGKRLNSPNDLVLRSDGALYITDPPYGLPGAYNDKRKELDYAGVILFKDGKAQVVAKDCGGPNGIAFSPDEKYLYVGNWDVRDVHHTKTVWRYEVQADGTLKNGKIFFDWNLTEDDEAIDGIKVDKEGNLFVSAPGGVWVISSSATLLGKIVTPERPANMAWGDEDGKTLYMTAHSSLYKVRVNTGGKFSWQ
jgi:gluconolactonase